MKAQFLIFGCLFALLCLSGCDDKEKEIIVSAITVSPATIPAMEIGDEVELTATITPADATEEILWVSWDENIAKVEGQGAKVKLKAIAPGTTRIFATNQSKIVVSRDMEITVNSDDYAGFMVGNYIGSGTLAGAFTDNLSGMGIKLERVGTEQTAAKLTIIASIASFGEQTIIADRLNLSVGSEPGTYRLSGNAGLTIPNVASFTLAVTGTFKVSDKSLTLSLNATAPAPVIININAIPGTPTDYGASAAGDYAGIADIETVQGNMPNTGIDIALTRITSSRLNMFLEASTGLTIECLSGQYIEITAGLAANTCALNGKATLTAYNMEMTVTGTLNLNDQTLTMQLSSEYVNASVTAALNITKIVVGTYAGTGDLISNVPDMMPSGPMGEISITMEKIDHETVKIAATTATGLITGEAKVKPDGSLYALTGSAEGSGLTFTVTGSFNPANKTLTLDAVSPYIILKFTATKKD